MTRAVAFRLSDEDQERLTHLAAAHGGKTAAIRHALIRAYQEIDPVGANLSTHTPLTVPLAVSREVATPVSRGATSNTDDACTPVLRDTAEEAARDTPCDHDWRHRGMGMYACTVCGQVTAQRPTT